MKDAHEKLAATEPVTAIDVLLEPDATMFGRAFAANQRLRENYPQGFALDATHQPHVTILHRFVRTKDLDKIYTTVGEVLAAKRPSNWTLKAGKFYYGLWEGLGIAGIAIKPADYLVEFQQKMLDAVAPFAVETGGAAAFATTREEPEINQATIDYVTTFVPAQVGQKFNPHVTIGSAHEGFLRTILDERFEDFTFSAIGLAVYQLGNFGTARKKLKGWELR